MLISIDHGNKQMKTRNRVFTSGLLQSDTKPPFGEEILRYNGKYYSLSDKRIVHNMAAAFADNLVSVLRECGIDLRIGKTVFVGGGSVLLKRYITANKKINSYIFVEDISANVKGYELMYRSQ